MIRNQQFLFSSQMHKHEFTILLIYLKEKQQFLIVLLKKCGFFAKMAETNFFLTQNI